MAVVLKVEISNFRSIRKFEWLPGLGLNCIIGSGDAGKSSILDAIDFCLGARRSINVTDADFHLLDVGEPISITLVLGRLDDGLKNIDAYGDYLRGFDVDTNSLEEEPGSRLETALCLNLRVEGDLEPQWSLLSERAKQKGVARNLSWTDRMRLAPTRLGASTDYNLAWRRGSVLNRLSEEKPNASKVLTDAAREARKSFGDQAEGELADALSIVTKAATDLGIPIGAAAKAMLDMHSVSFSGGSVALHNEAGVPLRSLGLGSTRLLIAGMQQAVGQSSSVLLVDEIENGLEPHRIIRFLGSLGAKDNPPKQQVFATSHSPVVLRELDASQLYVIRNFDGEHRALVVPPAAQGTIRTFPEAFLAPTVLICEGKTEMGFVRGIDKWTVEGEERRLSACGVSLADCDGGHADRPYERAKVFSDLGYKVGVFRDNDQQPTPEVEARHVANGGNVFTWNAGQAIEDAIFSSVTQDTVSRLIEYAATLHGEQQITDQISSASGGTETLAQLRLALARPGFTLTPAQRRMLGVAAKNGRGWFKQIGHMEYVTREIVMPRFADTTEDFQRRTWAIAAWAIASDA